MTDSRRKAKSGTPKGDPAGRAAFQVRLDQALLDALEACRTRNRRTRNTEIIVALEHYLQAQGFWPPTDA